MKIDIYVTFTLDVPDDELPGIVEAIQERWSGITDTTSIHAEDIVNEALGKGLVHLPLPEKECRWRAEDDSFTVGELISTATTKPKKKAGKVRR